MKPYGFKLSDGKVTYTRWFSTKGEPNIETGEIGRIVRSQRCLVFHQAYAHAKAAARENGLEFYTLYESDWNKLGNPVSKFFRKIFKSK